MKRGLRAAPIANTPAEPGVVEASTAKKMRRREVPAGPEPACVVGQAGQGWSATEELPGIDLRGADQERRCATHEGCRTGDSNGAQQRAGRRDHTALSNRARDRAMDRASLGPGAERLSSSNRRRCPFDGDTRRPGEPSRPPGVHSTKRRRRS
jgi:hypothetical protein